MKKLKIELNCNLKEISSSNYLLSDDESKAISCYDKITWGLFNLKKLYGSATRGKRLKGDDRIFGNLPFVTAGEANEGISAFIGNNVTIFSKNTITIDMFGSAKYRNYDYGGDDHVAVVHTEQLTKNSAIFVCASIHKSSHNGQFNYGRNFYAKDADALNILLPENNGKPDYKIMDLIVNGLHKIAIRDLINYINKKINMI